MGATELADDEIVVDRRMVAGTLMPGFVGTELPEWLDRRLRDGLGGVCIFLANITSRRQLRELTDSIRAANPMAIIAIDEEGGDVTRLYQSVGSPYPGNAVLGRVDDPKVTRRIAEIVGWELRLAGVNLNFAPDVDINSNPLNPVIGVRSFGTEPADVAVHAAAWIDGLQSTGVAASAKHFPGHGDTAQDSHLAMPSVDRSLDELQERELVPFAAAVAAHSQTIMTSHILLLQLDPDRPATFSTRILGDLLRGDMGFEGVIVSDAIDMKGASGEVGIPEAAVLALAGGSDFLCIGTKNTDEQLEQIESAVLAAVGDGRLAADRLQNAHYRVAALATELAAAALSIPIPEYITADDEPEFDLGLALGTFHVSDSAAAALDGPHAWVAIETVQNIAVGVSPWGPFAAGTVAAASVTLDAHDASGILALPDDVVPILVGKDNHRHAWVRDLIDAVRERRQVIVVDMGWPSDDRAYADIATFGASRYLGRALQQLVHDTNGES